MAKTQYSDVALFRRYRTFESTYEGSHVHVEESRCITSVLDSKIKLVSHLKIVRYQAKNLINRTCNTGEINYTEN